MKVNEIEVKDVKIEDLGIVDCDVYDVETGNHTFLGNGVQLHNSFYLEIRRSV